MRRNSAPKIWALGCNVTQAQSAVDSCCVEREICMRTCGMVWAKCNELFEKCATKTCGDDETCMAAAEAAEAMLMGGDSHMTVCKTYRDTQHEVCDCLPFKEAREGATARLTSFYAAFKPDKLDEHGNVRGVEEVWKKWQGREPELFFELTRKYRAEALEIRVRPEEELTRWRREEELARRRAEEHGRADEEEATRLRAEQEELARRQRAQEELEELARRQAEAETERRRAEVAQLRAEKEAAIAQEDFLLAKALKAKLSELDPGGEL